VRPVISVHPCELVVFVFCFSGGSHLPSLN